MFYIKEDENIVLYDTDREKLAGTLELMPQYADLEILETAENETIVDFKLVTVEQANEEALQAAKKAKYEEATNGAAEYLASGNALYELTPTEHIEATDGNIGKLTAYALGFLTGAIPAEHTVTWTTKEDVTIELTQAQLQQVIMGLGTVQAEVWNVQFPAYVAQIEAATTVEEMEAIVINYGDANDVEETPEENSEVV